MPQHKKLQLDYYSTDPGKDNIGMKHVLLEVTDDKGAILYDWGFADWVGTHWDIIPAPEGWITKVVWWASTLHPDLLLKEKSKIIKI